MSTEQKDSKGQHCQEVDVEDIHVILTKAEKNVKDGDVAEMQETFVNIRSTLQNLRD